jgi:hypothetical protein
VLRYFRNMKNIIEYKRAGISFNQTRISTQNSQTCSVANLHGVATMVLLVHGETFEITYNMVGSTNITVLIRINFV